MKTKVFLRTPYNYDVREASLAVALKCDPKRDRTLQSQAEDADINVIMKRFANTGVLPQGHRVPTFGDFTGITDFREAMDLVREAERAFLRVPAELRRRLDHDPQKFIEFCEDPANLPELRKYGFAVPEVPKPNPDDAPATKGDIKQLGKDRTSTPIGKRAGGDPRQRDLGDEG